MPTPERVQTLIDLVERRRYVEALKSQPSILARAIVAQYLHAPCKSTANSDMASSAPTIPGYSCSGSRRRR